MMKVRKEMMKVRKALKIPMSHSLAQDMIYLFC